MIMLEIADNCRHNHGCGYAKAFAICSKEIRNWFNDVMMGLDDGGEVEQVVLKNFSSDLRNVAYQGN